MVDYFVHNATDGYDWQTELHADISANGTYSTDLIHDFTMARISDWHPGDDPLFMWVSHECPHEPFQIHNQQFKDLYPNTPEPRKTYLAMMSYGDMVLGEMVKSLIRKGMWDNTFLYVTSDNGGWSIEPAANNCPFRGQKSANFEGGTRTIAFATGPLINKTGYSHEGT